MILTKTSTTVDGTTTVTYTETGEDNLLTNMIDGIKAPFLKENEFLPAKAAFWASVAYGTGGVVGGSMVARSRQAAGKAPMLKVFF